MTLTTLLAILQQSEYDFRLLEEWYAHHQHDTTEITPQKWTSKLTLIQKISHLLFFLPILSRLKVATALTSPLEWLIRQSTYLAASLQLSIYKLQGLTVVAIAGSYAKTSTKHIINHALSPVIPVYVTPHSYNTLLGIAQVILKELKPHHKVFIVEMGEYHRGDLRKLCNLVHPDYGILTPIGRQHLDIIGGEEGITAEMNDYLSYFDFDAHRLLVAEQNQPRFTDHHLPFYGTKEKSTWQVKKVTISRAGTEFDVTSPALSEPIHVFSPLFGEHQATNLLPALWIAHQLKIDLKTVAHTIASMPYISRRHEPTFAQNDVLVLDNSYNTNPDSVKESLKLLNQLDPTHRIIVTLGFVETGKDTEKIHQEFGETLAKQVDYLGLIESPATEYIKAGFLKAGGKKSHVFVGKNHDQVIALLQSAIIPRSVILLEGGYQELYT